MKTETNKTIKKLINYANENDAISLAMLIQQLIADDEDELLTFVRENMDFFKIYFESQMDTLDMIMMWSDGNDDEDLDYDYGVTCGMCDCDGNCDDCSVPCPKEELMANKSGISGLYKNTYGAREHERIQKLAEQRYCREYEKDDFGFTEEEFCAMCGDCDGSHEPYNCRHIELECKDCPDYDDCEPYLHDAKMEDVFIVDKDGKLLVKSKAFLTSNLRAGLIENEVADIICEHPIIIKLNCDCIKHLPDGRFNFDY